MKMKIKVATIARIGALVVAIANEILAFLGKDALPFTENMVYQVISLVFTIVVAAINCWYNQDVSQPALICGKIFDAMKDGNLSEKEIEAIVTDAAKAEEEGYKSDDFLIEFANSILKSVKDKADHFEE